MARFRNLLSALCICGLLAESCLQAQSIPAYKGAAEPSTSPEIYGQGVRETPWRTPEEEQGGFHLPPDFVIELVASEPDIAKPINMAFDSRGRLWVSSTMEYPYPASNPALARDAIKIIEDTDGDGAFDHVKTFADGLNIPMGVLPVADGAIGFSIPNLWHFKDTDGDNRADERVPLLGPFDTSRDTHGMINGLRMGQDGWVYACHGYHNQSDVTAKDGSRVRMNSGNTFRFRPDGSRIEIFTHGQVNPFGMTSDEWGNWYTADCHSRPLTALLPDACYESFGRPHDGLGFAPSMMDHMHGSTAICGVEYYLATQFPPAYQRLFYSGNVMTSRINCNATVRNGMTVSARELADFLTSDDPWFRPVDVRVGPDGCLYIADFYNKIIGHYEVALEHPERDRTSGRIWRIRYAGTESGRLELPEASSLAIVRELRVACGWIMPLDSKQLQYLDGVGALLDHRQPEVVKAAIELVGRLGDKRHLPALQNLAASTLPSDPVRLLAIRIAIRNILQRDDSQLNVWMESFSQGTDWSKAPETKLLVEILPAIKSPKAAEALLKFLAAFPGEGDPKFVNAAIDHALQYPSPEFVQLLVGVVGNLTRENPTARAGYLVRIADAFRATASGSNKLVDELAVQTQAELLELLERRILDEGPSMTWLDSNGQSWNAEPRRCADGRRVNLLSSLTRGEQYIGSLKSEVFPCPPQLEFWLAGHNGLPDKPDGKLNRVQLVDATSGQLLMEAFPPRNDTAAKVSWDLRSSADRRVILQIVDRDSSSAFAWLGIARISLAKLNPGTIGDLLEPITELARRGFGDRLLTEKLGSVGLSDRQRATLVASILQGDHEHLAATLAQQALVIGQPSLATLDRGRPHARRTAEALCRAATAAQQPGLARALLSSLDGCELLVEAIDTGWLSSGSLHGAPNVLPESLAPELRQKLQDYFDEAKQSNSELALVENRLRGLDWSQTDIASGHQMFKLHCANCHQLASEGTTVGPQLDGAIQRGVDRLAEDILLPNLNVDRAFRVTIFLLDDGTIVTGKIQDEDDRSVRCVGSDGKQFSVSTDAIEQRRESDQSLMPGNLGELLTDEQLADLLKFLSSRDL